MELGLWLQLNTNRKSYMTFKMVTFNLTFKYVTLKGQTQVHEHFDRLYLSIGCS